jgi:hypothetical protein
MTDQSLLAVTVLKETPTNRHLLRGFGPLLVGLILFVLMVLLAPTVARERDVTIEGPAPTTSIVN